MTRTPYSRQLWQILGEAAAALLGFTVFGAGAARLIADSSVGDAATLVGVLSIWFGVTAVATGFLWQSGREACRVLRRRRQWRARAVQRTPRWYHEDEAPPLDPATVAQDARIADGWTDMVDLGTAKRPEADEDRHAAAMAAVAEDTPLPERTAAAVAERPLSATVPMPTVDATAVLPVQAPYAVRYEFDPAGARTVVPERVGRAAA